MYLFLSIVGAIVGIAVTGAAAYTVWSVYDLSKRRKNNAETKASAGIQAAQALRSWTIMDYGALILFGIGSMMLFADLLAVMRDRDSYPYYHYGYLFVSFVFMLAGMIFMVVRLAVILRDHSSESMTAVNSEHHEPNKTDQPNHGI